MILVNVCMMKAGKTRQLNTDMDAMQELVDKVTRPYKLWLQNAPQGTSTSTSTLCQYIFTFSRAVSASQEKYSPESVRAHQKAG